MMRRTVAVSSPLMREHNLGLVLRTIADGNPVSRAQIATTAEMTKATVSKLVDVLIAAGLVADLGTVAAPRGAGRPGSALKLSPTGPVAVGLEINVDYFACCVLGFTGVVRSHELVVDDFRRRSPESALGIAAAMVKRAVERSVADGATVAGVGIAVPGLLGQNLRTLRLAPNLGWRDLDVISELRERTGFADIPMRVDNEANLAALGELWSRKHPGLDSFALVFADAGVGAGIVLDRKLLRGSAGLAGEIGHVCVNPGGIRCACGATGCLEAEAGQERILELAGIGARPGTTIGRPEGPLEELMARAHRRDKQATHAIETAGKMLGLAVSSLVNLVDVNTIMLGGIYAALSPWLQPAVQQALMERVIGADWREPVVLVSALGGEAALHGAASSILREVIENPAEYV